MGAKGKKGSKSNVLTRAQAKRQTRKQKFIAVLAEERGNITAACQRAGIARKTHYEWESADPDYAAAVSEIYSHVCDRAEQTIQDIMLFGEVERNRLAAAETILKARGKSRGYGVEKRDQSVSGQLDVNAKVQDVRFELPDDHTGPGTTPPMPPGWETATGGGE